MSRITLPDTFKSFFTKEISFEKLLPPVIADKLTTYWRLSTKQKIYLFRQLSYLIDSGYSIEMSLIRILGEQNENKRSGNKNSSWRKAVGKLIRSVRDSGSLANALEELNIFSLEIIYQARGGELSGSLPEALFYISKSFESSDNISRNVKVMMIYPCVLITVLIGAMHIMSKIVLPEIMLLVNEVGAELSTLSKVVIYISGFIADYGLYLLLFIFTSVIAFFAALKRKPVRRFYDGMFLKILMVRDITRIQDLIRYSKVFSALFGSGVDLSITLDCAANAVKNTILRERALIVKDMVIKDGTDFALALSKMMIFDDTEIQLIDIGAGVSVSKLCEVFRTMSERSAKELDARIMSILAAMEPASIIILGIFVGLFVIGIYSPVYSVIGSM